MIKNIYLNIFLLGFLLYKRWFRIFTLFTASYIATDKLLHKVTTKLFLRTPEFYKDSASRCDYYMSLANNIGYISHYFLIQYKIPINKNSSRVLKRLDDLSIAIIDSISISLDAKKGDLENEIFKK